jgi:hypothetical protein
MVSTAMVYQIVMAAALHTETPVLVTITAGMVVVAVAIENLVKIHRFQGL